MTRIVASAPGKVVVAGEYAVLDGAPAICMAVNRRATAIVESMVESIVESTDGKTHTVSSPGFVAETGRFIVRDGVFEWLAGENDYRLVEHVWLAAHVAGDEVLSITLDTSGFRLGRQGSKIGIGSSAALTVALAGALAAFGSGIADMSDTAAAAEVARRAHRAFQSGRGSGVDVACSAAGGVIVYRSGVYRSGVYRSGAPSVESCAWPDGLHYALLWSGIPADTAARIAHLDGQKPRPSRGALAESAERFATVWKQGDARPILRQSRDYAQALAAFDADHGLGIFAAGHSALVERANMLDVVYKPCGAGGGDIGIALAADRHAIASFVATATAGGFEQLDLQLDPVGAHSARECQR